MKSLIFQEAYSKNFSSKLSNLVRLFMAFDKWRSPGSSTLNEIRNLKNIWWNFTLPAVSEDAEGLKAYQNCYWEIWRILKWMKLNYKSWNLVCVKERAVWDMLQMDLLQHYWDLIYATSFPKLFFKDLPMEIEVKSL